MYDRKKTYVVERVAPKIWFANFENQYDLAMTFLRYAEFYESPNPDFKGRQFTLVDYMEWYSKTYGDGAFTYAKDWVGFNVPAKIVNECLSPRYHDKRNYDWNFYDSWMQDILYKTFVDGENSYILGSVGKENDTFLHELSHAMYSTDPNYRFEQNQNINAMDKKDVKSMRDYFIKIGYADEDAIIKDEIQAYMATGLTDALARKKRLQSYIINFQAVFNKRNPLNIISENNKK